MLIGHYGVGFAGRAILPKRARQPSLGTWFLACQWLDLVWPILMLTGIEQIQLTPSNDPFLNIRFTYYPWTHSLLAAIIWGALFAVVYRWRTGEGSSALWLAGGVVSHWILDFIVHVPDLPLYPGSGLKVGLGLWRFIIGTVAVEGTLFVFGVALYRQRMRPTDAVGRWTLWGLIGLLIAAYVASLVGPPPQSAGAIGVSGLLLWLLVPWAYWIDRHHARAASN